MFEVPTIMTADEILDKAFRRANKVQISDPNYRFRMQKLNSSKVDSATSVIVAVLKRYVEAFPSFDNIPEFYRALIDLMFSVDKIRRSLGRIDGARKEITRIGSKTARQIKRTGKPTYMNFKRNEAYGRISSIVKALDPTLRYLDEVRNGFKQLPAIPTKYPTAVIAGSPNVGKSQLIGAMSTATPKVASYPFTSQELSVGHFMDSRDRYQLVDTPGLLDRPFDERNSIEKQAVLALTLLTDLCIYMVDPTGNCGFPLEPQLSLLDSLFESIPGMRFLMVVSKSDLDLPDHVDMSFMESLPAKLGDRYLGLITISAKEGTGLDELRAILIESLEAREPRLKEKKEIIE